jgi:hypothetical protein
MMFSGAGQPASLLEEDETDEGEADEERAGPVMIAAHNSRCFQADSW